MLNELFIDSSVEYSHRRAQCPRRIQSNVRWLGLHNPITHWNQFQ